MRPFEGKLSSAGFHPLPFLSTSCLGKYFAMWRTFSMPICPPLERVRAVFMPTGVPPRLCSLRHSRAFFASDFTPAGMVYKRAEAVKESGSEGCRLSKANSAKSETSLVTGSLESSHSLEDRTSSSVPYSTSMPTLVSTTTATLPLAKTAKESCLPRYTGTEKVESCSIPIP